MREQEAPRRQRDRRSQSDHAPSFSFYWRDWLADGAVQALTYDQQGRLLRLLCFTQGTRRPGVMTEDQVRTFLDYAPEEWGHHRRAFAACFRVTKDRAWIQARAKREADARRRRFKAAQEAGKRGARKRHDGNDIARVASGHPMPSAAPHAHPSPLPLPSGSLREPASPHPLSDGGGRPAGVARAAGGGGEARLEGPVEAGSLVGTLLARVARRVAEVT